jgi:hypothetical protein
VAVLDLRVRCLTCVTQSLPALQLVRNSMNHFTSGMSCVVEDEPPLPPLDKDVDRQTAGPGYIPYALCFDSQHNNLLSARGILNNNTVFAHLHMVIPVGCRTNRPVASLLLGVHHWRWIGRQGTAKTTGPARKLLNELEKYYKPPFSARMRFILSPRSCEYTRDPPQ